jgi:Na+/glutamate symporter
MPQTAVTVITMVSATIGIIVSIIAIITFVRSSKKNTADEGAWRQRQEDATRALNTKIEHGQRETNEKLEVMAEDIKEIKKEQKANNDRMARICAYHPINHPGQNII